MSFVSLEYSDSDVATFDYFYQSSSRTVTATTIELLLADSEESDTTLVVEYNQNQQPISTLGELIGPTITLMNYDLLTDSNNSFLGTDGGAGVTQAPVQRWG